PDDATCSGTAASTSTRTVAGNGSVTSDPLTTTAAGTYRWTASYSGDANHAAVISPCNAPNESVVVTGVGPITPTLTTTASQAGPQYTDTAVLGGGTSPAGTITFTLFGPNDATCAGTAAFTSTSTVSGNGSYTSAPAAPTASGTYRWVAVYGGDANHAAVTSPCNAPNESFVVQGSPPLPVAIATHASPSVLVGGQITDTATLAGGNNPTGTITFTLFGPDDATCSGTAAFGSTRTVAGAGSYTSAGFTPTAAGVYRWRAAYSGDGGNAGVGTACNDPGESVTVTPVAPPPPCTGSQFAGTHSVGETFTIVFTPPCAFVSPPPVTKKVNGVAVGSHPASNGTVSVTITVVDRNTLSVDDPVLVPAVCGTNTATATGASATGQPVTQTATFTVVCPGPPGPP
ncbi:MAG: hypothetical protein LC708_03660, partial [Actinobacteria bacterium]|nr:hypothetical protein [Actinomycetota bacterium]